MSLVRHTCLIYATLDVVGGVERARSLLRYLSGFGEITTISSVYKRFLSSENIDLNARMEFVLRFETVSNADQTLHLILAQCKTGLVGLSDKGHLELTLLVFDDMVIMSPRLTLPYPQMHQDPLIIRCAAEAWGHYEHPIYQKNLSEISKSAPPASRAEFYIQGKSLVDF